MIRDPKLWFMVASAVTPYFGHDIHRVLWEADLRQVLAVFHGVYGGVGDCALKAAAKQREQDALLAELKGIEV